jgi:hypothetical protein
MCMSDTNNEQQLAKLILGREHHPMGVCKSVSDIS